MEYEVKKIFLSWFEFKRNGIEKAKIIKLEEER